LKGGEKLSGIRSSDRPMNEVRKWVSEKVRQSVLHQIMDWVEVIPTAKNENEKPLE
jgi:hypothetical protein